MKKIKKKKSQITSSNEPQNTKKIALLITGIVLAISPFFRGLYFDPEALYFLAFIGVSTLLIAYTQLKAPAQLDLVDMGILGLAIWYIITIPFAANTGGALIGTLRIIACASLYYVFSRSMTHKVKSIGMWLLSLTSAVVVLIGIGSSVGVPQISGGWGSSLSSTFQYRNALGAYLLLIIPATFFLYRDSKVEWKRLLALGLLYIELLGIVGTQSRGTFIIFAITLFLLIASIQKTQIISALILFIALGIAIANWGSIYQAGMAKSLSVLCWPFAGLFLVYIAEILLKGFKKQRPKRTLQIISMLLVAGVLAIWNINSAQLAAKTPTSNSQLGGPSISATVASIDISDSHFQERLYIYQDALKMFKQRPIVGYGANGFSSAYKGFQSYVYYSTEPHSTPIKFLVEAGLPGLLFYILMLIGLFFYWLKSWRTRHISSGYLIGVGIVGVVLHSLIDIDLSLSSIFFAMLFLMASLQAQDSDSTKSFIAPASPVPSIQIKLTALLPALIGVLGIILIISSLLFEAGIHTTRKGISAQNSKDPALALSYYQQALKYNPFQGSVYADCAQVKLSQSIQSKNPSLLIQAQADVKRAIELAPTDPLIREVAAKVYSAAGKSDLAYKQAKSALALADLYPKNYETFAMYSNRYAQKLLSEGNRNEAQVILENTINLPLQIEARLAKVTEGQQRLWLSEPQLLVTPELITYINEARKLKDSILKRP